MLKNKEEKKAARKAERQAEREAEKKMPAWRRKIRENVRKTKKAEKAKKKYPKQAEKTLSLINKRLSAYDDASNMKDVDNIVDPVEYKKELKKLNRLEKQMNYKKKKTVMNKK
jgi:hypothetical protein